MNVRARETIAGGGVIDEETSDLGERGGGGRGGSYTLNGTIVPTPPRMGIAVSARTGGLVFGVAALSACSCSTSMFPVDSWSPEGTGGAASSSSASSASLGGGEADSSSSSGGAEPTPTCGGTPGGDPGPYGYYTDSNIWRNPVDLDGCVVCQAKLPAPSIPTRTWTSCGEGCVEAPTVIEGEHLKIDRQLVVGKTIRGLIYYKVVGYGFGGAESSGYSLDDVRILPDDRVVALLRRPKGCFGGGNFTSPWAVRVLRERLPGESASLTIFGGYASPEHPEVQWAKPGLLSEQGLEPFDFDGGWGVNAGLSTIKVALTPGSSELTTVFGGTGGSVLRVWTHDDLVIWSDWSPDPPQPSRARIRSWTRVGGTKVLVPSSPDWDYSEAAMSDTRLVWLGVEGPDTYYGNYSAARLFWSPLSSDPTKIQAHDGPMIQKYTVGGTRLVTWGSRAALSIFEKLPNGPSAARLFVVDLDAKKEWYIVSRPGRRWLYPLAMNDTEMIVSEMAADAPFPEVDKLVRLDLSKLDALAAAWGAP